MTSGVSDVEKVTVSVASTTMLIYSVDPSSGSAGTVVTYTGMNLDSVRFAVFVDSTNVPKYVPAFPAGGGTTAIAIVPAGMAASNGRTWLQDGSGHPSNSLPFTFT